LARKKCHGRPPQTSRSLVAEPINHTTTQKIIVKRWRRESRTKTTKMSRKNHISRYTIFEQQKKKKGSEMAEEERERTFKSMCVCVFEYII